MCTALVRSGSRLPTRGPPAAGGEDFGRATVLGRAAAVHQGASGRSGAAVSRLAPSSRRSPVRRGAGDAIPAGVSTTTGTDLSTRGRPARRTRPSRPPATGHRPPATGHRPIIAPPTCSPPPPTGQVSPPTRSGRYLPGPPNGTVTGLCFSSSVAAVTPLTFQATRRCGPGRRVVGGVRPNPAGPTGPARPRWRNPGDGGHCREDRRCR
jgi:hypothetical protein